MVEVGENLGMKVNIEKTEIQHMERVYKHFNIGIMNHNLKQTVNFVYLGGNLSSKKGTISDGKKQIWIGRVAFITAKIKLHVYEILVFSCLLYYSETWTMKCSSEQQMNVFEMTRLGITRRDKLYNDGIKKISIYRRK